MPAPIPPISRPRLLVRSVQIAILALGSVCVGCQSVDYSQSRHDRLPRLVAGLVNGGSTNEQADIGLPSVSDMPAYNGDDVWQRLAERCRLVDGQGANERIIRQRDWLLSNKGFVSSASVRASPYLHFIVERLDERQMPMELALLPMIESSYNPMANSPAAAAGLWQFVPSTGRAFNLRQSTTYDARRDVVASSKAAMDYLTRLHGQFGNDWLLALAAYNAGEGTVGRAIEANRRRGLPVDYWHLSLPKETQDYVPRLLALSMLVRNPAAYGVKLNPIANVPYFDVVELNHAVDLSQLAATTGVDEAQLVRLNPAFLRKKTPDGPGRLLIPKVHKQALTAGIQQITGETPVTTTVPPLHENRKALPLPAIKPAEPVQVAEQLPVQKPVHPVKVAEQSPGPVVSMPVADERPPIPKVAQPTSVAEQTPPPAPPAPAQEALQAMPAEKTTPALVAERSEPIVSTASLAPNQYDFAIGAVKTTRTRDDHSAPRKREDIEYRSGPRELPTGPRVVVYASDVRQ
ncbi:lytic transglycosylase domain-containing protein [Pseudomonas coronafaciens]|uniref:lytic transglycosylase domain-containing protein n=2 Tax=Pseudomonas coronafaciens TaxID=53409 RepID=UPI000EFDDDB7|nr:lytic transglycosylase domain-containing protein [Pseudomonas coronafaciens]RMV62274.1 Membrane-bound lytic murein transglycosylase D [Pseudomonas coronafaciens pv. atropurpurea]